jgi:hypothetical protein
MFPKPAELMASEGQKEVVTSAHNTADQGIPRST